MIPHVHLLDDFGRLVTFPMLLPSKLLSLHASFAQHLASRFSDNKDQERVFILLHIYKQRFLRNLLNIIVRTGCPKIIARSAAVATHFALRDLMRC